MLRAGRLTQLEWIDMCANELALDGVDFAAAHFPRTDDDYLAQLKKLCVDRWLTIAAMTVDSPIGASDEDAGVSEIARWIGVASAIGAPLVRIASARESSPAPTSWPQLVRSLKELSAHAKRANVTLAMEPQADSLVGSTADAKRAMKECDSAWLRLALTAAQLVERAADGWVDLIGDSVIVAAGVRRLDTFGADETLDYRRAVEVLAQARYRGFISLEYQGDEEEAPAVARAAAWMRSMLAKDELKETAMEP